MISSWALAEGIDAGVDERSGALFSYVDLEARVGKITRCGRSASS